MDDTVDEVIERLTAPTSLESDATRSCLDLILSCSLSQFHARASCLDRIPAHIVAVTRELAEEHPDLVKAVYHGFCTAKDRMQEQYVKGMTFNNMAIMLPWFSKLIEEDRALLGDDWWPYGVQRNRSAIDVVLRYHHKQGLTKRRLAIEDVFFPGLFNT